MSKSVDDRVRASLDEAESRCACLEAGGNVSRRELDLRLAKGELVRPLPRLYARRDYWKGLLPDERALHKMRGLARLRLQWVFAGSSAALVHGAPVSYDLLGTLEVVSDNGSRRYCGNKVRGVYVCEEEAAGVDLAGLRVTDAFRTALDCARSLPFRDAVAIVDGMLHDGLLSKDELLEYLDGHKNGVHGIHRAREVAAFADGRSGSGGESIARAAMHELGFAEPELQVPIEDPVDGRTYFIDFLWRLPGGRVVAGELDGGEKYVNPEMTRGRSALDVMRAERQRESRITASCDSVVRFSPDDVANPRRFGRLLDAFGVPRDHEPLILASQPIEEEVPLECYGV